MSDAGLRVRNLAVSFGAARILWDLSLTVLPGEVTALAGPNGAGKTTTLRTISGLVQPTTGSISMDGRLFVGNPARTASAGVVHVPEGRGLYPNLTVRENLRVGALAVGRKLGDEDITRAVAMFPKLAARVNSQAGVLSGGEQQMVAIARGLASYPKILMIDELSLGLAPAVIEEILESLIGRSRDDGLGLLLVDQNVRLLSRLCDRVSVLKDGRAISGLHGDDLLRAAYFGGG